jgi:predicted transcriptional regulator
MREAIETYIGERDAFLAAIDRGLADMKAGRVVPHAQVKAWVNSWGTEAELPLPKARKRARRRAA